MKPKMVSRIICLISVGWVVLRHGSAPRARFGDLALPFSAAVLQAHYQHDLTAIRFILGERCSARF